jgi:preprotein translocase subunit SecE
MFCVSSLHTEMIVNSFCFFFVLFCWLQNYVFVSQEPTDRETKMVRKWTQKTFLFFGLNLTYDDTNLSLLYTIGHFTGWNKKSLR